jgi:hypothetical protein
MKGEEVIRIPIPYELVVPLLIGVGVLAAIGLIAVWRTEGWDGTKGMSPKDAERTRSQFQEQFRREFPIYAGGFLAALLFFVVAMVSMGMKW